MKNLNIIQQNRLKKIEKCISLLSKLNNSTAIYNIELLNEYKDIYIIEGGDKLPDRLIAELNCC